MNKRLRFRDLRERGIVRNRVTLTNWIRDLGLSARPANRAKYPNLGRRRNRRLDQLPACRTEAAAPCPPSPRSPAQGRSSSPVHIAKTREGRPEAIGSPFSQSQSQSHHLRSNGDLPCL